MRRKIIALALVLLVLVSVLPPGLAAGSPKVVFESGPADANGVFTVTMKAYDMTVWGIQFALKYDKDVIQPVKADGTPTEEFADFAGIVQPWTEVVNEDLYADIGLLGSAVIVSLDMVGAEFDEYGDRIIDSEGVDLFTFRFKRLKDGDSGLELAAKAKGDPWQEECPEGIIVANLCDVDLMDAEVIFKEADGTASKSEAAFPVPAPEVPAKTADDLLAEAIMLKIDSHAAVVPGGNVSALYPGEKMVTAYAHDNRTFVPVRFVGERLGANVGWDNDTQTVTVEKDGKKIEMAVGSNTYYINGEAKTLDAPAEFTPSTNGNSRTMVPIRFVSEALGYQVEWDQARQLVIIVPPALGWDPAGTAEAQAMDKAVINLGLWSSMV